MVKIVMRAHCGDEYLDPQPEFAVLEVSEGLTSRMRSRLKIASEVREKDDGFGTLQFLDHACDWIAAGWCEGCSDIAEALDDLVPKEGYAVLRSSFKIPQRWLVRTDLNYMEVYGFIDSIEFECNVKGTSVTARTLGDLRPDDLEKLIAPGQFEGMDCLFSSLDNYEYMIEGGFR